MDTTCGDGSKPVMYSMRDFLNMSKGPVTGMSADELVEIRQYNKENNVQAPLGYDAPDPLGPNASIGNPGTPNPLELVTRVENDDVREWAPVNVSEAMKDFARRAAEASGPTEDDLLSPTAFTETVQEMVEDFDVRAPSAEPDIRYIPKDVRPHPEGSDTMVLDFSGAIDGGGVKDSMVDVENKPRMALVPHALIWGCAKVLTYGAKKYAAHNWRRGMRWGECADALLRHFFAWLEGEDVDPESGLSHLAHCSANLAFLMHMETNPEYALMDDRPQTRRFTEDG